MKEEATRLLRSKTLEAKYRMNDNVFNYARPKSEKQVTAVTTNQLNAKMVSVYA